ncbi:hypothetical protein VTO42DRAFT_6502 [Malbranchea cinnamomea]
MAAPPPPRKRQRRLVVESSDDDKDADYNGVNDGLKTAESGVADGNSAPSPSYSSASTSPRRKRVMLAPAAQGTGGASSQSASQSFPSSSASSFLPGTSGTTLRSRSKTQQTTLTDRQLSSPTRSKRSQNTTTVTATAPNSKTIAGGRARLSTTPGSSPEKSRSSRNRTSGQGQLPHSRDTDAKGTLEKQTRSLRAFFQPATEEQRWDREQRTLEGVISSPSKSTGHQARPGLGIGVGGTWEDEDDLIEDDGVDEIFAGMLRDGTGSEGVGDVAKEALGHDKRNGKGGESIPSGKKFALSNLTRTAGSGWGIGNGSAASSSFTQFAGSTRPWFDEFAPTSLEELAVHKKKVADVQTWLMDVFSGRSRRRILVLRGPAGSGKTTTVSLLSKVLGYDIVEWKNSAGSDYATQGYVSMGAQFEDFLGRSDKFSILEVENEQHDILVNHSSNGDVNTRRRLVLIEEFPTYLASGSLGLIAFRTALQRYLAAAVPPLGIDRHLSGTNASSSSPPIVIIVSETLLGTGSSLADNLTVHRLLGPEILNHPGVSIIEFNRVAPTFISKALDLVLRKEGRRSKRKHIPGPAVLKQMSEMGDIRSAISSLEFLCLRGDDAAGKGGWSGTLATRTRRPGKSDIPATVMEKESLEMVTQRESSLGVFHAVGKVVYNKREDPAISGDSRAGTEFAQPPAHLQEHARPKVSQVSVDDLINETGTDIHTFVAALHENYVLSCSGSTFIDSLENCISWISDADILGPDSRIGYRTDRAGVGAARPAYQGHGGNSIDVLRQGEIGFQVAVRGLLFSLPYPVKRRAIPGRRAGDAHKMFFPTSLRLWREREEIEGLLDIWTRRLTNPNQSLAGGSSERGIRTGGVESWKNRFATSMPAHTNDDAAGGEEEGEKRPAVRVMISREEVLLERLPYLSKISRDPTDLRQLDRLTRFHGIVAPCDEPVDDEVDGSLVNEPATFVEQWHKDHLSTSPRKRRPGHQLVNNADTATELMENSMDKLILSDDDIED